ncbi:Uncharacterised protein [Serratia liquefaciens]|nr:Uncharacterised protein [Serratia liquefaciens]
MTRLKLPVIFIVIGEGLAHDTNKLLSVSGCQYQDDGAKRIYHLTNKATVIEYPRLPVRSRFQFL